MDLMMWNGLICIRLYHLFPSPAVSWQSAGLSGKTKTNQTYYLVYLLMRRKSPCGGHCSVLTSAEEELHSNLSLTILTSGGKMHVPLRWNGSTSRFIQTRFPYGDWGCSERFNAGSINTYEMEGEGGGICVVIMGYHGVEMLWSERHRCG